MATLPNAVQRQLDAAEALAAPQGGAQPQGVVNDASQLLTPEPTQTQAPATPPAAPEKPPEQPQAPPPEDWQQKYRTLQGIFQREVPELKTTNRRLESELNAMRDRLQLVERGAQQQPQRPAEPQPPQIDKRDVQAFGEDMVEMVNRYAQNAFQRVGTALSEFDARIKALEGNIAGVSRKTDTSMESVFYSTLEQLVPDWRATNVSPEWLSWLGEIDPVYGVPRQTALDVAFEQRDAARVATVFKTFKAASQPRKPEPPPIAPAEGGGPPPAPPAPAGKPVISQKAVNQFYLDQARGRYAGRENEEARIEAEINLAAAEGRIV